MIQMPSHSDLEGLLPTVAKETRLPPTNRDHGLPVYEAYGVRFYGSWTPPRIPINSDDLYIDVPESGHEGVLERIAKEVYGTEDLWWVIAASNSIIDPFADVTPGMVLRVPLITTLYARGILAMR